MTYIVLDGVESAGKTTQVALLADNFRRDNYEVLLVKEPGSDDPLCRQIRSLLLNSTVSITPTASLCLFLADRCQNMLAIKEALAAGKVVISDRSSFSSFVYYAASMPEEDPIEIASQISPLLDFAQQIKPDWCFVCSADFDWCREQLGKREKLDRIELLGEDFHKRTHKYFGQHFLKPLQINMKNAPEKVWFCQPASSATKEQIADEIYSKITG